MKPDAANCLFADAFAFFDQGACYDEDGDLEEAKTMYNKGLELVTEGLKMKNAKKSELYKGIMETQSKILERISELKTKGSSKEKVQKIRECLNAAGSEDAELIYWLPDGVQLVTIDGDKTAAPTDPSSLAILKLDRENLTKDMQSNYPVLPEAFMQVGPWAYPLITGKTAILKNELGIYVVPNPTPENPDMVVGIILPRGIDSRLEKEFVDVLKRFSVLKSSEIVEQMSQEQRQRTSERISQFLIKSGEMVAQNVNRAATATGEYVAERGGRYRSSINPTSDPVNVNPAIRHGVYVLHKGSKMVGKVTKFLLDKIGDVGVAIGKQVAGGLGGESSGRRFVQSTATVLGGGITGVSTIWISLEDASKTLFRNFANETVQTVHLKYGEQASETTHHVLYAAGHSTLAGFQLWDLGPRSIAGRMARKAGIQVVQGSCKQPSTSSTLVNSPAQLDNDASVKTTKSIEKKQ